MGAPNNCIIAAPFGTAPPILTWPPISCILLHPIKRGVLLQLIYRGAGGASTHQPVQCATAPPPSPRPCCCVHGEGEGSVAEDMAKKDSAYSLLRSCGGDASKETQQSFKGSWATGGGGRQPHGTASAKASAVSCSAAVVVAQRALLASSLRRVGGGRRIMAGGSGTKSTPPSRLSKVSAAAEDVAS